MTKNTTQKIPPTKSYQMSLKKYYPNGLWTKIKQNLGTKKKRFPILIWTNWVLATKKIKCFPHSLKNTLKLAKTLPSSLIKSGLLKPHKGAALTMDIN